MTSSDHPAIPPPNTPRGDVDEPADEQPHQVQPPSHPGVCEGIEPAATAERPTRDCQHSIVHHEHGTRAAYVGDRCRCSPCTAANRAEARRRRTAIAYGRWSGLVDAGPSRQHLGQLRTAGLSLQRICSLSGVGYGTLAGIVYGDPSRHQPPTLRVRSGTQRRLLDVHPDQYTLTDSSRIVATPTHRRLQALAALGWPLPALALRLGRSTASVRRTLTTATVTVATARTIAALYDTLHVTAPPTRNPAEQRAAADTREQARLNGWLPPPAWDDIDTDHDPRTCDCDDLNVDDDWLDEIAIERAMNGDHIHLTRAERDEAIYRLTARGWSARCIAEVLEISSRSIVRRRSAQRTA